MATLTIRNLPDDLHQALKARARQNRRSLNQEVIAELASLVPVPADAEFARRAAARERVARVSAEIDEIRGRMSGSLSAEEIDAAKEEGRV